MREGIIAKRKVNESTLKDKNREKQVKGAPENHLRPSCALNSASDLPHLIWLLSSGLPASPPIAYYLKRVKTKQII